MQNFGKIKNGFNELLIKGIGKKDDASKKLFKQYIKTIKESEVLRTEFLVYHNIENKVDNDSFSANLFITENIKLLDKYDKALILKENQKLGSLLGELSGDYELSKLHESLSNLIFVKRTANNVGNVTDEIKVVTAYVTSNKPKEVTESINMPISILTKLMTEKYNEKYDTLSVDDKIIIKTLINSDFGIKKELYVKTVTECMDLVDGLIKEGDAETKERLLRVKGKLLEDKENLNESDFAPRFSKLIELKNNLISE
jgi:hypothetical protein